MSTLPVIRTKRISHIVLVIAAALVLAAGLIASWQLDRRSRTAADPLAGVPILRAAATNPSSPKVGDLFITQEAMELAEIQLGLAAARLVAEKLPVSGTIEPGGDRLVRITPRVAGKVVAISVVAGDAVRAGQTLARIESTELAHAQAAYRQAAARVAVARQNLQRQRELARLGAFGRPHVEEARRAAVAAEGEVTVAQNEVTAAEAEVAEAQSHLRALEAALTQAQTRVKVAESRFRRQDALFKEELTSRQDWEQAQADFESARADVEAARANLAQGEARLETGRAKLRAAQARLAEAEKRAEIASQALAREEAVYKGRYVTSKEIVEAEAALQQAVLDQQAAEQNVRLLGGQPGGGSMVALATPISGRVQERSVSIGETVDTEHALFTVIDLKQVWAQLAVAPKDLALVRPGQRVELTAEAAPGRVFTGTVSAIGNTAEESTRMVRVRVALANPDSGGHDRYSLRPQTFVRGHIITDVRRERVTVPPGALQEHLGKPTVYVARGDLATAFEVRHVTLGVSGDSWREIASGLKAGERIAVNGTFYLKSEALKSQLSDGCCAVPGE